MRWVSARPVAPLRHLAVVREVAGRPAARIASTRRRWCARGARRGARAAAARRQARRGRGLRARAPLRPLRRHAGGVPARARRRSRPGAARDPHRGAAGARRVVVPSAYLREIALGWGLGASRVVCPEPGARAASALPRARRAAALGIEGFALGTAGRLTAQKALGDALEALARVPDVELLVLGDGPERRPLERRAARSALGDRVRFLGAGRARTSSRSSGPSTPRCSRPRGRTCRTRCSRRSRPGTPVIATAGGIPEVVSTARTACSSRRRRRRDRGGDRAPRRRRRARRASLAAGRRRRSRSCRAAYPQTDRAGDRGTTRPPKPRVLMVGRTRYRLPLTGRSSGSSTRCGPARPPRARRGAARRLRRETRRSPSSGAHPSRRSTAPSSTARSRPDRTRAAARPRTRSWRRALTRPWRRSPDGGSRGATLPSSSRSTATGAPGRGSTARGRAPWSRRSPTGRRSSRSAARMRSGRSRRSRRASSARRASSPRRRSRRTRS